MSGSPIKTFFGWCLMAVGALIAVSAGLCTAWFVAIGAIGATDPHTDQAWLPFAIWAFAVGSVPIALGVGLLVLGRRLSRKGGGRGR